MDKKYHKANFNIVDGLWEKFRIKALKEKKTCTELIIGFINKYLKERK